MVLTNSALTFVLLQLVYLAALKIGYSLPCVIPSFRSPLLDTHQIPSSFQDGLYPIH